MAIFSHYSLTANHPKIIGVNLFKIIETLHHNKVILKKDSMYLKELCHTLHRESKDVKVDVMYLSSLEYAQSDFIEDTVNQRVAFLTPKSMMVMDRTIPPKNYTNSDVEPYVLPADIESRLVGSMRLESTHFEVTNIQLEAGTDGGSFGSLLLDASASSETAGLTDENAPIQLQENESIFINTGFDNIVLNGTDGSSTNANSNIREEAGSFLDQLSNATVVIDTSTEGGFDSNQFKFDSVQKTFDSTI